MWLAITCDMGFLVLRWIRRLWTWPCSKGHMVVCVWGGGGMGRASTVCVGLVGS